MEDRDDAALLDRVWDLLGAVAEEHGLDALGETPRAVLLALRFGALADQGGLDFLLEHEDALLVETRGGLEVLGLERPAHALDHLIEQLSVGHEELPEDVAERMAALERWRGRCADGEVDDAAFADPDAVEDEFARGPFAAAVADAVRSAGPAGLGLPAHALDPSNEEPESPDPSDSVEDAAAWIEALGGGVLRVARRARGPGEGSGGASRASAASRRRVAGGKKRLREDARRSDRKSVV